MRWLSKITAFLLALALMPGAFEIPENTAHLVLEGHLAHASPDGDLQGSGDRHGPADSEHGCTPTLHLCGCHASLALVASPEPPAIRLRAAGFSDRPGVELPASGFLASIDRPPQA
jgi:hypothetical protein